MKEAYHLTSISDLDALDQKSSEGDGVLIYKHSTRCFISSMAQRQLKGESVDHLPLYYLDLLRYRDVSNAIAQRYSVVHKSPQLLWIRNAKCVANASHDRVGNEVVKEWLAHA